MALACKHRNNASTHARNTYCLTLISLLALACSATLAISPEASAEIRKRKATIAAVSQSQIHTLRVRPDGSVVNEAPQLRSDLSSSQAYCIARLDAGAAWAIDEWIIGNELYKSYQDPVKACGGGYPYNITEIHMFLQVASAATITVATDIESIDHDFLPGCPVPGEIIRLGPLVELAFPQAGLYDVTLEMDTIVVVNEPFFVGFFFASAIDPSWHLSLITDNIEKACRSFNIWDTTIGFVDLGDDISVRQNVYPESDPCFSAPANADGCFDFDGVLLLHTGGFIGDASVCCDVPGDANNDGKMTIGDVTFLIDMLFSGGPGPVCNDAANANGDASINIGDVTRIIEAMFIGSAVPVCGETGS